MRVVNRTHLTSVLASRRFAFIPAEAPFHLNPRQYIIDYDAHLLAMTSEEGKVEKIVRLNESQD